MDEILEVIKSKSLLKDKIKPKDKWTDIKIYKAGGCEQCGGDGYKGRNGIFEVLEINDEIKKMISQKASSEELEKKARENGMLAMIEDGFMKVILGITSVEEILRVTKE